MSKWIIGLLLFAVVLLLPMQASAQGNFATLQPTFEETGHVPSEAPTTPPPRSSYSEYIDVLALFVALSMASYTSTLSIV